MSAGLAADHNWSAIDIPLEVAIERAVALRGAIRELRQL